MSSPIRVGEIRTVTTKFCLGALMVSEKWSQVASALRQPTGLEAVNGPPVQLTLGEVEEMLPPAGVEANSGAASRNTISGNTAARALHVRRTGPAQLFFMGQIPP